ncbi:MAG: leucyl aminopeptidase family protein [Rhodospirillales bacterium]|nr:leucyl aminopeptidase family protein [Rhodospirillales bacterium]
MRDLENIFAESDGGETIPLFSVDANGLSAFVGDQPDLARRWIENTGFCANAGEICLVPGPDGRLERVILGISAGGGFWDFGGISEKLPPGRYRLEGAADPAGAAMAWGLGAYRFDRYKETAAKAVRAVLEWPKGSDPRTILSTVRSTFLVRDLINTPAADMGPFDLAEAAEGLAKKYGAAFSTIIGDDLLATNYPAIHAVGRASDNAPRLIDLVWGDAGDPKVTLVGKGVCFDTGGLDLKSADGMKLMKKDMGGGAHVLGLAAMIMDAGLPIRLRVLVPAVENSVAGNALFPNDVIVTRSGKSVEIGNTDAEGRVILADALAEAASEAPEIIIDYATLTGAARVALGADLPALFCNDDGFADELLAAGILVNDPLWRMPLWAGYRKLVDGKTADLTNAPEGRFGGAITAALFLQEFVEPKTVWAHIDLMAWNASDRPGRPEGGEAMAMRAAFQALAGRFNK